MRGLSGGIILTGTLNPLLAGVAEVDPRVAGAFG